MTAAVRKTSPSRRALTGKVHIAKKSLGLDDDVYRGILTSRYSVTSSADLSETQLVDLVEHFKSLGFKPTKKDKAWRSSVGIAEGPAQRKIRALWLSLYHLGLLSDASEKALTAFVKRVSGGKAKGIDALQWLDGEASYKVIEALKSWATREAGVDWAPYKSFLGGTWHNERGRVIEAQWRVLQRLSLGFKFVDVHTLEDAEADRLIQSQGAAIRRAKAAEAK